MEGTNKVAVKIYGQEYTIAGEATRESIIKVADYVDTRMHEMGRLIPQVPLSSLAVLTAVNIAEEYFKSQRSTSEHMAEIARLEKDASHYVQLWEEAKKSYVQFKQDAQMNAEQIQDIQAISHEKTIALDHKEAELEELLKKYQALETKNQELLNRMRAQEENKESRTIEVRELTEKCKEMENGYFDLQMENIQLKGEVERLRKIVE